MRNLSSLITVIALSFSTLAAVGCATSGDVGDTYAESDASAPGKMDLWQATDGQWHFHLVSGNGRILLTSEAYTSRTGALNGVLSVLDNGVDPAQYQLNQTKVGWNLHLRAANYETIGFTESYSSKSNATRAIGSCVRAVTSYLDHVEANTTGARVEVEQGESGQFHFNVFAKNGEIILSSEAYTTKAAAWNGAFAVQAAAADAANFTILNSSDERFYFTLTANNGEIVGVSQMYTSRQAAQDGIASVKTVIRGIDLI